MISFEEFENLFYRASGEPEFEVIFRSNSRTYMIIKYDDHVSFQRCGLYDGSGESNYFTLRELYKAELIDEIKLKDMWNEIETIIADATFDLSLPSELADFISVRCGN